MRRALAAALIASLAALGRADDAPPKAERKAEPKAELKEESSRTRHAVTLNGKPLHYVAEAGNLVLRDDDNKPAASVYYIAYTKAAEGGDAADTGRPVTLTFNGGPGSSSVWLHLGAFGPKRVQLTESGEAPPPPYKLVDNDLTLLDLTDLVFIDPVSTGFSRPAPGVDAKKFHGVQEDVAAVGEVIRRYVTKNNRWGSPKYVAGESYGTTRAAALAGHLQDRLGMNLNGVVLVSAILNFQTARFDDGNDLPPALFLPTYTATAWYHKKLAPDLQADRQKALAEAEQFARGDYTVALMQGDRLPTAERHQVAKKLARLTGLSEQYVEDSNLRVEAMRFMKELLRDRRRSVGRYDSRLLGIDRAGVGDTFDYDPSYASVQGAYTATLNAYLRDELKLTVDQPYEILTGRVQPWNYGTATNRYLNVAGTLRSAMTKNPSLRVFVASGQYDLATPYFATDYTLDHLGLDESLRGHVTTAYYPAGHMMYTHRPSHEKLRRDLAAWLGAGK